MLLTPSAAGEAPLGLGSTGDPSFNAIWTLGWTPCLGPTLTGVLSMAAGTQGVTAARGVALISRR